MKSPHDIQPYEKNPRNNDHAVQYVANSIKEFGFKVPIILDKDDVIVAGDTRLKAALELGLDEVPTIYADDLTEVQIKAYRIADNKVAEIAKWDNEKLSKLLEELDQLDFDLYLTGFNPAEIDLIFAGAEGIDIDGIFEEVEPVEKKVKYCPHCGGEL